MAWALADLPFPVSNQQERPLIIDPDPGGPAQHGHLVFIILESGWVGRGPLQEPSGQRPVPSWRRRCRAGRRPALPAPISSDVHLFDSTSVPRRDGRRRELLPAEPEAAGHGRPWTPDMRAAVVRVPRALERRLGSLGPPGSRAQAR